jgi:hypothetical protein
MDGKLPLQEDVTMNRELIPFDQFSIKPFHLFDKQWLLLTSGDLAKGSYNCMTISWAALASCGTNPLCRPLYAPPASHGSS